MNSNPIMWRKKQSIKNFFSRNRRSKGRDEEDEENLHALSSTKPEAEGVEMVRK